MRSIVRCVLLAVSTVACSSVETLPSSDVGTDVTIGSDAGRDGSPTDARSDARTTTDARFDGPAADSGWTGDPYQASLSLEATAFGTVCECLGAGGDELAGCIQSFGSDPDVRVCLTSQYEADPSGGSELYACIADAGVELNRCVARAETNSCDELELDDCLASYNDSVSLCPQPEFSPAADTAFDTCFDQRIIGSASSCPENATTSSALGAEVFSGNTRQGGNDSTPDEGCSEENSASPDRAFQWTAPSTARFVIDTEGSGTDTILYVRSGCSESPSLACNDDISFDDDILQSRVVIDATQGSTYIIVVDGWDGISSGPFVVNINREQTSDGGTGDGGNGDAGAG